MGSFYLTTAIDYPNSRPHIGTAFEKIGVVADAAVVTDRDTGKWRQSELNGRGAKYR